MEATIRCFVADHADPRRSSDFTPPAVVEAAEIRVKLESDYHSEHDYAGDVSEVAGTEAGGGEDWDVDSDSSREWNRVPGAKRRADADAEDADLAPSAKKHAVANGERVEVESDESDESDYGPLNEAGAFDDVPCLVCGQKERDARQLHDDFVLCDNVDSCRGGGHLTCLKLTYVPKDVWFCSQCEDESDGERAEVKPRGGRRWNPKSKYFGVSQLKGRKWKATHKNQFLGTFDTEVEAARAYRDRVGVQDFVLRDPKKPFSDPKKPMRKLVLNVKVERTDVVAERRGDLDDDQRATRTRLPRHRTPKSKAELDAGLEDALPASGTPGDTLAAAGDKMSIETGLETLKEWRERKLITEKMYDDRANELLSKFTAKY